MAANDRLIVVIDPAEGRATNLKALIEFMDVPSVCIASPEDWRSKLGDRRLAAVFLGQDIPERDLERLIGDVGNYDPNVSIVLVGANERS